MSKENTSGYRLQASRKKGFTLVELLVVIGILVVLLAIVLVAINPGRQFSQANNTKRRSDTSAILNAINQYMADNKGVIPAAIGATAAEISSTGANICANLMPKYLAGLPTDPSLKTDAVTDCTAAYATGYNVVKDANNRITVSAPSAEIGEAITVTR